MAIIDNGPVLPVENRTIVMPTLEDIVVSGDNKSQVLSFAVPRYFDDVDLSTKVMGIKYINADGQGDKASPVATEIDTDTVTIGWLIDNKVTIKDGEVSFALEFIGNDYIWQTVPAKITVSKGLDVNGSIPEPDPSWIDSWRIEAAQVIADANAERQGAESARDAAITAKDEAAASAEALASVYTRQQSDDRFTPSKTAQGTSLAITDHLANSQWRKLLICGGTTLSGEPSPDNPATMTDWGDCNASIKDGSGAVASTIAIPALPGLPMPAGATDYTHIDGNGQKWLGDTLEWLGGDKWRYTQRMARKTWRGTETWIKNNATYDQNNTIIFGLFLNPGALNNVENTAALCTHLPVKGLTNLRFVDSAGSNTYLTQVEIKISKSVLTPYGTLDTYANMIAALKAYLAAQYAAGTPMSIVYQIANPITTEITLGELLPINGAMSVSQDGEHPAWVIADYNRDIMTALNELAAAIVALQGGI